MSRSLALGGPLAYITRRELFDQLTSCTVGLFGNFGHVLHCFSPV